MRTSLTAALLLLVGCTGADDKSPDTADDTDTVDASDDTDTVDDTVDDTDPPGALDDFDKNPQSLTSCPALDDLAPDELCADIEGYGVAMFQIWQARANVIDSRTDEDDTAREVISLQVAGSPSGDLYDGTYTCDMFPGFVYFYLRTAPAASQLWSSRRAGASCTITFTSGGHIQTAVKGTFSAVTVADEGDGGLTRTVDGVFFSQGSPPAAR